MSFGHFLVCFFEMNPPADLITHCVLSAAFVACGVLLVIRCLGPVRVFASFTLSLSPRVVRYLAKDLGAAGVDIDYEEMWHADCKFAGLLPKSATPLTLFSFP